MQKTIATTTFDFKTGKIIWDKDNSTEASFKIRDCHY